MFERPLRIALTTAHAPNYFAALKALGAEGAYIADAPADSFDGLLLPGGVDVDPSFYGQPDTGCEVIDRALDEVEFAAIDAFLKAGKPIMGICRGEQILNVALGGTLVQDLAVRNTHTRRTDPATGTRVDRIHPVRAVPGTWMSELYGTDFTVNSAHHQAVDVPAAGLRILARAADGTVEAYEHESLPVFAVQWHPERMCFANRRSDTVDGAPVLKRFLMLCQKARGAK